MPIAFACGTCGKPYKVDERFAGKKAACRACGTVNNIPAGGKVPRARCGQAVDDAAAARADSRGER